MTTSRTAARESFLLKAGVEFANGSSCHATVRNISHGGIRLKCPVSPHKGETVMLDLPQVGKVAADVTWTDQGGFGAAFHHALDPQAVRRRSF